MEALEEAGTDVFVARQPIFWTDQKVMGYELLYRGGTHAEQPGADAPEAVSSSVLVSALLAMGLRDVTGGHPAFISFTRELLLDETVQLLDPKQIVIELHESVRPDEEVLTACRILKEKGFVLALANFEFQEDFTPLLELAQIVKVDVFEKSREELKETADRLVPYEVHLLAERVESAEIHEDCVEAGFVLFQGFHYLRPETLTQTDLSTESVAVAYLMNLLSDMSVPDRAVEEGFRSDPALSYKLLRMVNSAALGGRGVTSIEHALRLLGRQPLYRWVSMLMVSQAKDGSGARTELIKSSLFRGHLCELIGDQIRGPSVRGVPMGGTLFLIGLFSRIDILMKIRMEDLFKKVDLAEEAKDALLWRQGVGGQILQAVEAYESGKWEEAERILGDLGFDPHELTNLYLESLAWAGDRLAASQGEGGEPDF
jgi:EAL and modified HD-GYP domain-containing signal transduction protein